MAYFLSADDIVHVVADNDYPIMGCCLWHWWSHNIWHAVLIYGQLWPEDTNWQSDVIRTESWYAQAVLAYSIGDLHVPPNGLCAVDYQYYLSSLNIESNTGSDMFK